MPGLPYSLPPGFPKSSCQEHLMVPGMGECTHCCSVFITFFLKLQGGGAALSSFAMDTTAISVFGNPLYLLNDYWFQDYVKQCDKCWMIHSIWCLSNLLSSKLYTFIFLNDSILTLRSQDQGAEKLVGVAFMFNHLNFLEELVQLQDSKWEPSCFIVSISYHFLISSSYVGPCVPVTYFSSL